MPSTHPCPPLDHAEGAVLATLAIQHSDLRLHVGRASLPGPRARSRIVRVTGIDVAQGAQLVLAQARTNASAPGESEPLLACVCGIGAGHVDVALRRANTNGGGWTRDAEIDFLILAR